MLASDHLLGADARFLIGKSCNLQKWPAADVLLGCKFASEVSIFANFSISKIVFLCASPATNLLLLTHCFCYCVASFNYRDSRARDVGPTC